MIPELRKKFNSAFTHSRYEKFLADINSQFGYNVEFRIAETPIFLPEDLKNELLAASDEIISFLQSDEYQKIAAHISTFEKGKGDVSFPEMLALDFAVCKNDEGKIIPQLIELQGFPSLYCYQSLLDRKYREHFGIDTGLKNYFSGLDFSSHVELLKQTIVGDSNPEKVILLEIQPEKQKTRIDFSCTEKWLGIKPVCITEVLKEGKELFYYCDGKETKIERIYNRVILDELQKRTDLKLNFNLGDDLDVKWIPHPSWFFRISKFTLPYLSSLSFPRKGECTSKEPSFTQYVPPSAFLNDMDKYPDDLENYILKPLFSFAGSGVIYDVTKETLDSIPDKQNYILQKKISYAPVIETPDVPAKAEIRLLFLTKIEQGGLPPCPIPVHNIVRLSKGKMMGVDFNKDQTWVGSSIAYFY